MFHTNMEINETAEESQVQQIYTIQKKMFNMST